MVGVKGKIMSSVPVVMAGTRHGQNPLFAVASVVEGRLDCGESMMVGVLFNVI
jgi:hypothetical protein